MPNKCQSRYLQVKLSAFIYRLDRFKSSISHKDIEIVYQILVCIIIINALGSAGAYRYQDAETGASFCGHASFSPESNHFRSKRSLPIGRLRIRSGGSALQNQDHLLRSSQTRFGTDININNNNYNYENNKQVIDSNEDTGNGNSNSEPNFRCSGNRDRRDSSARLRRQKFGGGSISFEDDCSKQLASSRNSSQEEATLNLTITATSQLMKTIETAVFIDQALDNRFNGLSGGLVELNRLVLTIMNQVQHLFRYSSLHVPIKIKLVLIEHLKDSEKNGFGVPDTGHGDIDVYLSNFCNWQQTRLRKVSRNLAWDHAILLSGLDLYKATPQRNQSGVLGLAWVGGMCKGNYSCTVNEASNFESAFVIAHELGHSLGIMHDFQHTGCDPNGFIMSERTGAGKVNWSKCSNKYLSQSIKRKQLQCLDEESTDTTDSMYDLAKLRAPGQTYTINEQCKLAFGNNYTSFVTRHHPFNNVCRELWCVAGTWAKAAHPALEASACADHDRICREGKCVQNE